MRWLGLALVIAGCGDNRSPCDYSELDDTGNSTTVETSNVIVATVGNLCGSIDGGHYDGITQTVDVDRFHIAQAADGEVLVRIVGDAEISVLSALSVRIFASGANPTLLADVPLGGDHGVQLLELPAGEYDLVVVGRATGDLSGSVGYRVQLVTAPSCEAATGEPYREGTANNDAISIDYARSPIVMGGDGVAEETELRLTANNALHLAGTVTGDAHADSYQDRDSFIVRTDATANEVTVRLDYADAAADLDIFLFDPSTLTSIAAGDLGTQGAVEKRVFAVQPNAAYVLWVGGFKGTHAPVAYDVTLCGTHFFH